MKKFDGIFEGKKSLFEAEIIYSNFSTDSRRRGYLFYFLVYCELWPQNISEKNILCTNTEILIEGYIAADKTDISLKTLRVKVGKPTSTFSFVFVLKMFLKICSSVLNNHEKVRQLTRLFLTLRILGSSAI